MPSQSALPPAAPATASGLPITAVAAALPTVRVAAEHPSQKPSATEPQPIASAANKSQVPATFEELAGVLNQRLGMQQQAHHIIQMQAAQLTKAFGDVQLLVDMADIDGSPLNDVLKSNVSLNAVQVVTMRCWLNSLKS